MLLLGALMISLSVYAVPSVLPAAYARATVFAQVVCIPNGDGSYLSVTVTVISASGNLNTQRFIIPREANCPSGISTDPNNPTLGTLTTTCGATSDTLTFVTSTNAYTWTVPASSVPTSLC